MNEVAVCLSSKCWEFFANLSLWFFNAISVVHGEVNDFDLGLLESIRKRWSLGNRRKEPPPVLPETIDEGKEWILSSINWSVLAGNQYFVFQSFTQDSMAVTNWVSLALLHLALLKFAVLRIIAKKVSNCGARASLDTTALINFPRVAGVEQVL